jgi:hypothetical protein
MNTSVQEGETEWKYTVAGKMDLRKRLQDIGEYRAKLKEAQLETLTEYHIRVASPPFWVLGHPGDKRGGSGDTLASLILNYNDGKKGVPKSQRQLDALIGKFRNIVYSRYFQDDWDGTAEKRNLYYIPKYGTFGAAVNSPFAFELIFAFDDLPGKPRYRYLQRASNMFADMLLAHLLSDHLIRSTATLAATSIEERSLLHNLSYAFDSMSNYKALLDYTRKRQNWIARRSSGEFITPAAVSSTDITDAVVRDIAIFESLIQANLPGATVSPLRPKGSSYELLSIPGGSLGINSIRVILENLIRNAAKHSNDSIRATLTCIGIGIEVGAAGPTDYHRFSIVLNAYDKHSFRSIVKHLRSAYLLDRNLVPPSSSYGLLEILLSCMALRDIQPWVAGLGPAKEGGWTFRSNPKERKAAISLRHSKGDRGRPEPPLLEVSQLGPNTLEFSLFLRKMGAGHVSPGVTVHEQLSRYFDRGSQYGANAPFVIVGSSDDPIRDDFPFCYPVQADDLIGMAPESLLPQLWSLALRSVFSAGVRVIVVSAGQGRLTFGTMGIVIDLVQSLTEAEQILVDNSMVAAVLVHDYERSDEALLKLWSINLKKRFIVESWKDSNPIRQCLDRIISSMGLQPEGGAADECYLSDYLTSSQISICVIDERCKGLLSGVNVASRTATTGMPSESLTFVEGWALQNVFMAIDTTGKSTILSEIDFGGFDLIFIHDGFLRSESDFASKVRKRIFNRAPNAKNRVVVHSDSYSFFSARRGNLLCTTWTELKTVLLSGSKQQLLQVARNARRYDSLSGRRRIDSA